MLAVIDVIVLYTSIHMISFLTPVLFSMAAGSAVTRMD